MEAGRGRGRDGGREGGRERVSQNRKDIDMEGWGQ